MYIYLYHGVHLTVTLFIQSLVNIHSASKSYRYQRWFNLSNSGTTRWAKKCRKFAYFRSPLLSRQNAAEYCNTSTVYTKYLDR